MYIEITSETEIKIGDWVKNKNTGEIFQITNLTEGKFELKFDGEREWHPFIPVASQETLVKNFELQVDSHITFRA